MKQSFFDCSFLHYRIIVPLFVDFQQGIPTKVGMVIRAIKIPLFFTMTLFFNEIAKIPTSEIWKATEYCFSENEDTGLKNRSMLSNKFLLL